MNDTEWAGPAEMGQPLPDLNLPAPERKSSLRPAPATGDDVEALTEDRACTCAEIAEIVGNHLSDRQIIALCGLFAARVAAAHADALAPVREALVRYSEVQSPEVDTWRVRDICAVVAVPEPETSENSSD